VFLALGDCTKHRLNKRDIQWWKKCMMAGRGRLTASPRGKMHDSNSLRDQCADGNGLRDPSRRKNASE